ncbi:MULTISPECIES: ribosome small subunit-dependent GTPase A [unclassified Paenibacillus]|uniref:ribosome small subunit-dependent GTPase A n=1 Tax=unclassified Paenibacillus TaxID=185978 RepID=UPI0019FBA48D|nr:ribosome small subunit-dependent GTPase A [Paenibacillus sp. Y412MC10]
MNLEHYGWNTDWQQKWLQRDRKQHVPGRIVSDFGQMYRVWTSAGEVWGEISGRLKHEHQDRSELPAVGDWVEVQVLEQEERVIIHGVLERKTCISRQAAGVATVNEQIIASNVDTLFLVSSLNDDFNVRRMERYLIMAWNSGVTPVILLSKADLCPDAELKVAEMEGAAPGVPVHAISALEDMGRDIVSAYLGEGITVALTGSSGCGKSTIVNWLSEAGVQKTQGIREDDSRGRHTTTHRQLFLLPQGGIMADTPGMRELRLFEDEGGLAQAFSDIEEIGGRCRFADCKHEGEAGCAVREAVEAGVLEERRLSNYHKTQRELKFQAVKEARSRRKADPKGRGSKSGAPRKSSSYWTKQLMDE